MDLVSWLLLSFIIMVFVFKLGQSYERGKPELTFKFTCLQPHCRFHLETSNHDETIKLANEHALVHRAKEEEIAKNSGTSER